MEKWDFVKTSVSWISSKDIIDSCFVLNFGYKASLPWPQVNILLCERSLYMYILIKTTLILTFWLQQMRSRNHVHCIVYGVYVVLTCLNLSFRLRLCSKVSGLSCLSQVHKLSLPYYVVHCRAKALK